MIEDDDPRSFSGVAGDRIRRLASQVCVKDDPSPMGMDGRQEGRMDPLDGEVLHSESRARQGLSQNGS